MEDSQEHEQAQQSISQQRWREKPQVTIVRPSNRRKFLMGALGGALVMGVGGATAVQMVQGLRMALNTKWFPFESYKDLFTLSYSPDLNLLALLSDTDALNPHSEVSIWDYQRQSMTTLPTGPVYYRAAWSHDNKYLLLRPQNANNSGGLDLWDIQTRQRIQHYDMLEIPDIYWSPDGGYIALLTQNKPIMLSVPQLQPVFALDVSPDVATLAWSPDNSKLVLLVDHGTGAWKLQIWDVQTQQVEAEAAFQGQQSNSEDMLAWSPNGAYIAACASKKLCIIHAQGELSSFLLDEPDYYSGLAWSPDSRYLAVSSSKGGASEFCVWDVVERTKVHVFMHYSDLGPDRLAWSKDGRFIVSILDLYKQVSWPWP